MTEWQFKITVILPTYNRENLIGRSIDSVLSQTYTNLELLIIDDASMDCTEKVVKSYTDSRINYVKLERNSGACIARNLGIQMATGDFVAFLDSDDKWDNKFLEKLTGKLVQEKADVAFCRFSYRDSKNKKQVVPNFEINTDRIYEQLLYDNFVANGAILLRRECLEKESFDVNLKRFQDWDLYLRIFKNFKCVFLDEILLNVYYQPTSITGTVSKEKVRQALEVIYKKNYNEIITNKKIYGKFNWRIGVRSIYTKNPDFTSLKIGIKYSNHKGIKSLVYIAAKFKVFYLIGKIVDKDKK